MNGHVTVSHDDPGAMHYRAKDTAAGLPGPACSPAYVREGGMGVTDDPYLVTCSICDAREARNLRARDKITGQLAAIVAQFPADGGAWKVDTDYAYYGHSSPRLVRSDGVTLWAHTVTYGPGAGRLEISAGVPEGASHSEGDTRDKRPSVTVDPTRPANTLGKDITRRLIPAAVTYWQTVSGRIASRQARQNTAETLANELASIMGNRSAWESSGRWRAYTPDGVGSSGTVETYDGVTVSIELNGLSAVRARELAEILAGWVGA